MPSLTSTSRARVRNAVFVVLALAACRATPPPNDESPAPSAHTRSSARVEPQASRADFTGAWSTTYSTMNLTRSGDTLRGTYGPDGTGSSIEGSVEERRFSFRYDEADVSGEGWFELAADGASFSGKWHEDDSEEWHEWTGERAPPSQLAQSFAGVWTSSYGILRLAQDGARAHGTYTYAGRSTIEGLVEGDLLRATYVEPDGTRGAALFQLAGDGASFRGVWSPDASATLALDDARARKWTGTRVVPVEGRVWLVILEAHWEGSLAAPEYSYGEMLRSFFTRLPNVEVRHRFFHDRADFVRFCGELAGLVEPVVLYVSSHGSRAGIQTADGLLDGATIGAALRDTGDLTLVHFGACEMMAGGLAKEVREAAAPHAAFPISGFPVAVDWAGSALVDFTYMELVLGRGLSPADAVKQTRAMLSFAGPAGKSSGPIPGTGLTILDAEP